MCASYGLDPRFPGYREYRRGLISLATVNGMVAWVVGNDGATIRPTGKNLRNLNPIIQHGNLVTAWWGQIVGGEPAKFPSINTRLERVLSSPGLANKRVLIPLSEWYEYQKPAKTRYAMSSESPFMLAGLTTQGRLADASEFTCYSIITGPPAPQLAVIHDRMPLVLPTAFFDDWLDPTSKGSRSLVEAAIAASDSIAAEFTARRTDPKPDAPTPVFD